jgi:osomolarity two-component system sensor histidine kinase NIK1
MDPQVLRFPSSRTWRAVEPLAFVGDLFSYATRDIGWLDLGDGIPHGSTLLAHSASKDSPNPKSLNVLVVEDTYSSRRQLELILMNQGHHVVTAADGQTAVELAKEFEWDVILMDLQLPILNGWQATEAIRRHERLAGKTHPVPIIAQSAYAISGNRERSMEVGMNEFLGKPISPQRLIELVEQYGIR